MATEASYFEKKEGEVYRNMRGMDFKCRKLFFFRRW